MHKDSLNESLNTAEDFFGIFEPVKQALSAFGKTVAASAKLIGNDVGTLMNHTFHWKTRSLSKQKEIMDNWKSNRTKHISDIITNSNAALDHLGPDKYTAMMVCPSLFWTERAYRGTTGLLSEDTRALIGEFGANNLPIIGPLFDGQRNPYGAGLFDRIARSDAPPGSVQAQQDMSQALRQFLQDAGVPRDLLTDSPSTGSGIKNILYKINDIFLLSILDHHEIDGSLIREGEEKKEKSNRELGEEVLAKIISDAYKKAFKKERKGYIAEHKKVFDQVMSSVEQVLELNISMAATHDPDEFFKVMKETVSKNKDLKGIDVEKLTSEFKKMVTKLSEDPEVIKQLRSELEKKKEIEPLDDSGDVDPTQISKQEKEVFEKSLKKIALDNCKGSFLQTFKEGISDLYDTMTFAVKDGLQEKTIEDIQKHASDDELAMKYLTQIDEFQQRLDEAVSKLQ